MLGNVDRQHVSVMRHFTGCISVERDNVPVTHHHIVLWPVVIAVADHFVVSVALASTAKFITDVIGNVIGKLKIRLIVVAECDTD